MSLVFRAVKMEELHRLLRMEMRGRSWRCGLCGRRRLRSLSAVDRHAAVRHPREYRETVRRALLEVRFRFGKVPDWFIGEHASSFAKRPQRR
jgi:hypothetical protein